MADKDIKCPACGKAVQLGDITCAHCGVNLKSGESYESQVRRARGKARHPEHFADTILVGCVIAFALLLFASYMYQRRIEKVLYLNPPEKKTYRLQTYITRLNMIDALAATDDKAKAADILATNRSAFEYTMFNGETNGGEYALVQETLGKSTDVATFTLAFIDDLITDLEDRDREVEDEDPYAAADRTLTGDAYNTSRRGLNKKPEYSMKVYKRILRNIKSKAQRKKKQLQSA